MLLQTQSNIKRRITIRLYGVMVAVYRLCAVKYILSLTKTVYT